MLPSIKWPSLVIVVRAASRVWLQLPAALVALCSLAANAVAEEGAWTFSKSPDPMAGGEIALATIDAQGTAAMVRCWTASGELDLRFMLAPESGKAASEIVQLGFDSGQDVEREWQLGPGGFTLIVPSNQHSKVLRRLRGASAMRLGYAPEPAGGGQASTVLSTQLDIPLKGSSRAIGKVLRACR